MKRQCDPFSKSPRRARRRIACTKRRAVTLVEVLAGLLLLGTVLASALIARGRFLRQWAEADQRLAASRAADAMLATWLGAPASSLAVPAQGTVPDLHGYSWRTRWAPHTRDADALRVAVARLEIFG